MAVYITLFKFEKVNNSTKRPDMDNGTRFECRINMPCTVTRPNVALTFDDNSIYPDYNYCYIDQFHRYYFISEWTYANGIWFADCRVDTLASWWDDLKDTTQYVTRNATVFDTYCQDLLYPATAKWSFAKNLAASPFENSYIDGCFILGVAGKGNAQGSIAYYAMSYTDFQKFNTQMYNENYFGDVDEAVKITLKLQFNPMQYICSCMWLPFTYSEISKFGAAVTSISIGWWDVSNVVATLLKRGTYEKIVYISVPKHPQAARGKYMNSSPFTRFTLSCSTFGEIALDPAPFVDSSTLACTISTDLFTGKALLIIENGESSPSVPAYQLAISRGTVGVNLALTQAGINTIAAATSGLSMVESIKNAVTGIGGSGASVGQSIGNFINNLFPQVTSSGANGSLAEYKTNSFFILYAQFFNVVDDDPVHRGKPLCMDKQLSSLSGFTMVADASISLPATDKEREQLKFLMEGGFYIE